MPLSDLAVERATTAPDTVIKTVVNHAKYSLGDVVILKHQYLTPSGVLLTACTKCGHLFETSFRRMKKGRCEVRNVPRCVPCRRYHHKEK